MARIFARAGRSTSPIDRPHRSATATPARARRSPPFAATTRGPLMARSLPPRRTGRGGPEASESGAGLPVQAHPERPRPPRATRPARSSERADQHCHPLAARSLPARSMGLYDAARRCAISPGDVPAQPRTEPREGHALRGTRALRVWRSPRNKAKRAEAGKNARVEESQNVPVRLRFAGWLCTPAATTTAT